MYIFLKRLWTEALSDLFLAGMGRCSLDTIAMPVCIPTDPAQLTQNEIWGLLMLWIFYLFYLFSCCKAQAAPQNLLTAHPLCRFLHQQHMVLASEWEKKKKKKGSGTWHRTQPRHWMPPASHSSALLLPSPLESLPTTESCCLFPQRWQHFRSGSVCVIVCNPSTWKDREGCKLLLWKWTKKRTKIFRRCNLPSLQCSRWEEHLAGRRVVARYIAFC